MRLKTTCARRVKPNAGMRSQLTQTKGNDFAPHWHARWLSTLAYTAAKIKEPALLAYTADVCVQNDTESFVVCARNGPVPPCIRG